jgi:gliding motility-associated-like protein
LYSNIAIATPNSTTTYTVFATDSKGCFSSASVTISVLPLVVSTITGFTQFCSGSSVQISADGFPPFQWFKNGMILPGQVNGMLTVNQAGDYTVMSKGSNGCISSSFTKIVVENPLPNGSIITPITPVICEGSLKQIEATGGITYQWYLNSIPIPQALFSSFSATSAGIYTVDLISNKGCIQKASNSLHLSIIKKPVAQFSYDTYCINMPVTFTSQSITLNSGSVSSLWRIDNALNFSGISIKNTFVNKGIFKVLHFAIPLTCPQLTDSIEKNIIIEEPIQGINYPPVNVFSNKPFVLSARNIGNSFLWSPNQNLSNSQIRNPILTTSKEQLFQVRIAQPSGCFTVDTQLVRVFNTSEIYVPKGFTPDNDGSNDRLYPILVGIQEMRYFTIMNRWGNVLYNNKNASLTTGWDGTFKGTKLPMDTYVWIAEGIDADGKIITRNGNTILIR